MTTAMAMGILRSMGTGSEPKATRKISRHMQYMSIHVLVANLACHSELPLCSTPYSVLSCSGQAVS